jgi:hypothetical protein
MKTIIAICFVAGMLALTGCQKDSSESGNVAAPNNAPAAGMTTNVLAVTNSP